MLRTGCQWNALPKERFGRASAIPHWCQAWERAGFFLPLWQAGLAEYDDLEGIAWRRQSVDGAMVKAPLAQESVGPHPTDRGENGTTRMRPVDAHGVPLSLVVPGANRHDVTQVEPLLDALMVPRPAVTPRLRNAWVPTTALPANRPIRPSVSAPPSPTCGGGAKSPSSGPGERSRAAGGSRGLIPGATAFGNSWCGTKKRLAPSSP